MSKGRKAKKIAAVVAICSILTGVRPAQAMLWPVVDVTEIGAFVNTISSGLQEIKNAKSQFDNYVNTIKSIGDQVQSIKKYAADLTDTITSIKDSVTQLADSVKDTIQSAKDTIDMAKGAIDSGNEIIQNSTSVAVEGVESQVNSGAEEEEVQVIVTESKALADESKDKVLKLLDETEEVVNKAITETREILNNMADIINGQEGISNEDRQMINDETDAILAKVDALKNKMQKVIDEARASCQDEYDNVVTQAFDEYSQAISDYYAGKISREELTAAGMAFKTKVSDFEINIDEQALTELVDDAQVITQEAEQLKEKILNISSNNKDYSELNAKQEIYYVFNFHKKYDNVWAKGIYASEDKSFLLSFELDCKGKGEKFIETLQTKPSELLECLLEANEPDYKKDLYKDYKKNGVFNHIMEDYNVANIVTSSKSKQYADSWDDLENNSGTLYNLTEMQRNGEIKDTAAAYELMGYIDIESPKLWSYIRRVSAMQNAEEMMKLLTSSRSLYLKDDAFREATNSQPGIIEEKNIISNVFLYDCDLKAKEVSVAPEDKNDSTAIQEAEQKIHDCMFKYAEASSKGTIDGKCTGKSASCIEDTKKEWRERQKRSVQDSSFNNFTLAVINGYKSSRDYLTADELKNNEKNIVTMQKGLNDGNTARDRYSAGAQVNYYTAMQLLSIIDGEAQNLQSEIIKDLSTFDYDYFGKITDDPTKSQPAS